ncbi:SDR family oxidoreductase [Lentibacillus salicampi]|uniref:SDR family oxidoreductase n=1 Tax=Lentibacillus salicampi TaxID=175306 RepID=A0A4Y9AAT7_9BACI|nr:SDR family oxidoreductase [Lentibacillus salicampi]TFJ92535.1 SDR family oxidoreductase [Lentibacillus salicampi]
MNVLVAGANGNTGRLLIQFLHEAGYEAYGMVRKEEQKQKISELGGTPVLADLEGDVGHAAKGMNAVIFAAGSGSNTGPDKTTDVDRDGAINLVKATENFGIKKFIMMSSIGAGRDPEVMATDNPNMKHYLQMKKEADEYLMQTELDYTIVRPGGLTHDPGTSKIKVADEVEFENIPREDVAKTMIAAIQEPNTFHKAFEMVSGNTQIEDALKQV